MKAKWIIISSGLLIFGVMLNNTFVWDDVGFVYSHPFSTSLYSFSEIVFAHNQAVYRPLFYLFLNIISVLSQGHAPIFHLAQLTLHIINALLVYKLFRISMSPTIALLMALIFIVHPIQVESVAYMASISNVFICLFGILALNILSNTKIDFNKQLYISALLLAALLMNEGGISWIVGAAAFHWMYQKSSLFQMMHITVIPVFLYGILRLFISDASIHRFGYVPIAQISLGERLLTMPKVLAYYITTLIAPIHLSVAQHWTVSQFTIQDVGIPIVVDVLTITMIIVAGIYIALKQKFLIQHYLFFAFLFLVGIVPYLQIIPLDMTVADRWFYTPIIGLLGLIGTFIHSMRSSYQRIILLIVSVSIVMFSIRSIVRIQNWKDGMTLFSHDVKVNPNSFDIHVKLAMALMESRQYNVALIHAKKAIALQPNDISSLGTMAILSMQFGHYDEAIRYLKKLLVYDPDNSKAISLLDYISQQEREPDNNSGHR